MALRAGGNPPSTALRTTDVPLGKARRGPMGYALTTISELESLSARRSQNPAAWWRARATSSLATTLVA